MPPLWKGYFLSRLAHDIGHSDTTHSSHEAASWALSLLSSLSFIENDLSLCRWLSMPVQTPFIKKNHTAKRNYILLFCVSSFWRDAESWGNDRRFSEMRNPCSRLSILMGYTVCPRAYEFCLLLQPSGDQRALLCAVTVSDRPALCSATDQFILQK